jgi:hypothetical protein
MAGAIAENFLDDKAASQSLQGITAGETRDVSRETMISVLL